MAKQRKKSPRKSKPKPRLSDDQIRELADFIEGTCRSVEEVMLLHDYDPSVYDEDDIAERIEETETARCEQCEWWVETSELEEVDGCLICEGCRQ